MENINEEYFNNMLDTLFEDDFQYRNDSKRRNKSSL